MKKPINSKSQVVLILSSKALLIKVYFKEKVIKIYPLFGGPRGLAQSS
jgi:hypothetical protein